MNVSITQSSDRRESAGAACERCAHGMGTAERRGDGVASGRLRCEDVERFS